MWDLVNLHNNLNVVVRVSFFTFTCEEAEPQRNLKLYQDFITSKWKLRLNSGLPDCKT